MGWDPNHFLILMLLEGCCCCSCCCGGDGDDTDDDVFVSKECPSEMWIDGMDGSARSGVRVSIPLGLVVPSSFEPKTGIGETFAKNLLVLLPLLSSRDSVLWETICLSCSGVVRTFVSLPSTRFAVVRSRSVCVCVSNNTIHTLQPQSLY